MQVIIRILCIDSNKALCLNLARGRRIWKGARRSLVLCGVGSEALCMQGDWQKITTKMKSWWTWPHTGVNHVYLALWLLCALWLYVSDVIYA